MGKRVNFGFWSDEDRWFVPRTLGFGYSLNLKYVAKRLGWTKPRDAALTEKPPKAPSAESKTREERLREQIESSKYEDPR